MCLLDTIDGALMFSLYIQPAANFLPAKQDDSDPETASHADGEMLPQSRENHRDPVAFLYYSIVLTVLTVIVAIVIGVIQLLTLILNVTDATGKFWDGVQVAGDYYDAIGGGICGCFIIFGGLSVLLYKPWRRWMDRRHGRSAFNNQEQDPNESLEPAMDAGAVWEPDMGNTDGYERVDTGFTQKVAQSRVTATEGSATRENIA